MVRQSRRYETAPAHIPVILSQKSSTRTKNGIMLPAILFLAWIHLKDNGRILFVDGNLAARRDRATCTPHTWEARYSAVTASRCQAVQKYTRHRIRCQILYQRNAFNAYQKLHDMPLKPHISLSSKFRVCEKRGYDPTRVMCFTIETTFCCVCLESVQCLESLASHQSAAAFLFTVQRP